MPSLYAYCVGNNGALLEEWHRERNRPLTPDDVTIGSGRKMWWRCEQGHEWLATVASRAGGYGCPYCVGHRAIPGETDLATTLPALAAQWHPTKNGDLTARDVKAKSGKRVWWRCGEGHEWEARVADRSAGNGCPFCCGRRAIQGVSDLATKRPDLAAQWHPDRNGDLTPQAVKPYSHQAVWWRCERGHQWRESVAGRSKRKRCPYCGE